MDDLIAFMQARLDEDEAAAKAATPGPWVTTVNTVNDQGVITDQHYPPGNGFVLTGAIMSDDESRNRENAEHIARHDPARVLREVTAMRRIVDDYRITAGACQRVTGPEIDTPGYRAMCAGRDALRSCVVQFAAIWSDHPGYQQAAAP